VICPFGRYYICHAVFALAIAVLLWPFLGLSAGLSAGAAFYVGREYTQWEQGGGAGLPFDWPGLLAPVLICAFVYVLALVYVQVFLYG
jgi:hypothetical protein